ncbi:MAG: V-type ATP synthase subunit I [Candidatus Cryptobacteroides sp.]
MISKMTKYSFILLSEGQETFLEKLQELGVVDITRSAKPVDEKSSALLEKTGRLRALISRLSAVDYSKDAAAEAISKAAKDIDCSGLDAGAVAELATRTFLELGEIDAEILAAGRELRERQPWGDFDKESVARLAELGYVFHYYKMGTKSFEALDKSVYALQVINEDGKNVYFVVVASTDGEYAFPAQECPAPTGSWKESEARISQLTEDLIRHKATLLSLAGQTGKLSDALEKTGTELDRYLAGATGEQAAENRITTFTGFAPVDDEERLCAEFDRMDIYYLKEEAVEEDNPPIKLKNNAFSKLFECITGMYGMPVYGEWDPTPILSIFFFLFFAMCMGDAGYGIILIIYGILQDRKIVNISMFDGLGKLISVLGVSTTIVGFFLGTAFGVNLTEVSWIPDALESVMLTGDIQIGGSSYALQMVLAILIGVFHICLAMTVKAVLYTRRFGFKENISTWGWLILILGGIITAVVAMLGLVPETAVKAIVIVIGVVSALGIFIFNKPGRNPLINIGAGLWDTYNMATGILGDVLSYIRLYALGLAGGMLGGAFNNLGSMVLGTSPTWEWLPFVLILLFGHVLNILMSCLGAFVHPLRLNFVEYFKNSGYEGKGLKYNPLKK